MIHGKTVSGFEFQLNDNVLDNMELLELMVEVQNGNPAALIPSFRMILGDEQRKALYDHLRTEDGRVPVKAAAEAFAEIVNAAKNKGKN